MANPLEHRAATRGLVGSFQTLSLAWPSRRSAALWTPSGGCCRHGLFERKCAAAGGMAGAGCAAGRMGKETPSGGHGGRQQRLARTIDFACIQAMPRLAEWCVQSGVGSRSCDQASTAVAWACVVVDRVVCVLQACFVRRPECANLACAVIGVPCLRWSVLSERVECPCVGWWWLQVIPSIGKPFLCIESTQSKPQSTEVRALWYKSLENEISSSYFSSLIGGSGPPFSQLPLTTLQVWNQPRASTTQTRHPWHAVVQWASCADHLGSATSSSPYVLKISARVVLYGYCTLCL